MQFFRGILAGILALALSGCAGYRLGPSNGQPAGSRTIQIVPFVNRTPEPRMSDSVTAELRKQIQRDATFRLATSEEGDIIVRGELTYYLRGEISFLKSDTTTARDYRISLTAHVIALDRLTGKTNLDREITGNTLMRLGNDLPSAERQALPLLAADLARQITAALADGSW